MKEIKINKKLVYFVAILIVIAIPIALYFYVNNDVDQKKQSPEKDKVVKQKKDLPLRLDIEKAKKLEALVKNRTPLSESDKEAKAELIALGNPLAVTEDYIVIYDQKDDIFQAQLTTIKINTAKDEVVYWFKNQGFSNTAICTLPIQFTIDQKDAESLRGLDIIFNPLPPGC